MIRCCPGDLTHDVRHLTGAQITDQFRAGVEQATARAVADNARRQVELDVVTAELAHRQALPAPVAAAADTARRRADAPAASSPRAAATTPATTTAPATTTDPPAAVPASAADLYGPS